jgi:hypothetical protein
MPLPEIELLLSDHSAVTILTELSRLAPTEKQKLHIRFSSHMITMQQLQYHGEGSRLQVFSCTYHLSNITRSLGLRAFVKRINCRLQTQMTQLKMKNL